MTDNIETLKIKNSQQDRVDNCDRVFEAAKGEFEHVILVGLNTEGNYVCQSAKHIGDPKSVFLLNVAQHIIMKSTVVGDVFDLGDD